MTYYTPLMILVWMSLAILCILAKENGRFSRGKKSILYFTYLIVALAALAEWLGIRLNGDTAVSVWLLRVVKLVDYILTPLAGGAIVLQFQMKSVWRKALFAVLAANTLFQLVSLFTGWMISIDAGNQYSHGPGYNIYVAIYLITVVLVILDFAVYGRTFRRQNRFSLLAILILAMTGIVMQEMLGGAVRTAYISLVVCLALLYIHNSEFTQLVSDDQIQEQSIRISVDPLTGISSRYAYTAALQELSGLRVLPSDFVVFSIDINGLKTVNDSLGHSAGDELICGASDCIASVFSPYGRCFRTGGDEFIVLANIERDDVIDDLIARLEHKADEWRGREAPSLSLSAGSARAIAYPGLPIEKLVSAADQEMYRAKAAYYRAAGVDRRKN